MNKILDKYGSFIGITLVIIILVGGLIIIWARNNSTQSNASESSESEELAGKISELESKMKVLEENQQKIAGANVTQNNDSTDLQKSDKININTADQKTLESLPGIGEKRAADIINYRQSNGGFKDISEIKNIKGIGESIYSKIKDQISI
jgi:comEA protein